VGGQGGDEEAHGMKALLILLLLTGCKVSRSVSLEAPVFDDVPVIVKAPDQQQFKVLDDGGRLRLLVQDPITKYYILVR
jgi:hypothetical protein